MLIKRYKTGLQCLVSVCLVIGCVFVVESEDDILGFYCERAEAVADSRDPWEHEISFVLQTCS